MNSNVEKLHALIEELRSKRQSFASAIAEIDEAFQSLGVRSSKLMNQGGGTAVATRPRTSSMRGAKSSPAKRTPGRSSSGRKYTGTAHDLVLDVIRRKPEGATGAEISKAWAAAGRSGEAYNTLGDLVRRKMIKRIKVKNGRGSVYQAM